MGRREYFDDHDRVRDVGLVLTRSASHQHIRSILITSAGIIVQLDPHSALISATPAPIRCELQGRADIRGDLLVRLSWVDHHGEFAINKLVLAVVRQSGNEFVEFCDRHAADVFCELWHSGFDFSACGQGLHSTAH